MSILVLVVSGIMLILIVLNAWQFIFGYRIKQGQIQVMLFYVLPVFRIKIEDIKSIHAIRFFSIKAFYPSTLRLANKYTGKFLLIEKTQESKRIIITPRKIDSFIDAIKVINPELEYIDEYYK